MSGAERRIHRRFDMTLPIRIRVKTAVPILATATKDISARGLYFSFPGEIQLGTELECEVTLPPELCQGNTIQVNCRGRIVRVERREGESSIGVAATIEDYEFVKTE